MKGLGRPHWGGLRADRAWGHATQHETRQNIMVGMRKQRIGFVRPWLRAFVTHVRYAPRRSPSRSGVPDASPCCSGVPDTSPCCLTGLPRPQRMAHYSHSDSTRTGSWGTVKKTNMWR